MTQAFARIYRNRAGGQQGNGGRGRAFASRSRQYEPPTIEPNGVRPFRQGRSVAR